MTAPDEGDPTPLDRLAGLEQAVRQLTEQGMFPPPPAPPRRPDPPAPPPSSRWADRATPDDWDALIEWVDNVIGDYSIRGNEYIPACWPAHPGVVEELVGIWRAWIAMYGTDEAQGPAGSSEITMWHTWWFWPCLDRLQKGNVYSTTNCRAQKKHVDPVSTPQFTERSHVPAPRG